MAQDHELQQAVLTESAWPPGVMDVTDDITES